MREASLGAAEGRSRRAALVPGASLCAIIHTFLEGAMQRPGKIVCVGRNYVAHAKELGNAVPEQPLLFLKPPSAVIGDGEAIVLPAASRRVEHEAEIGVVLGRRLRQGDEGAARAAIAAITCVNDVTARDLQQADGQWTRAKGFDTFCPVGPRLLAVGAGLNVSDLEVVCRVNGVERQRGHATEMAFGIPMLVAYISRIMTLEPGDLVATGTPAGVGPLTDGDVVEVEIPGVGVLRNPVTAAPR
jgi:2-keto-4-pentenoate hydratase/2-oxohepta-3-ene-1,7-dioic acid hydratase in catechol pathway